MLQTTSAFVDIYGVKLHYYRTGGNKPPLVLVHGITDDGLCWSPVAEVLAWNYDVIMLDMRGHGKSDAPDSGYTLKTLALELAGLIQQLKLEKPVVLGHSMGAITTLVFAGLFPEVPGAILLEDPPAFWINEEKNSNNDSHNGLSAWIESNKRKTYVDLLNEAHGNDPKWSEAEIAPWIDSKHRYSIKIVDMLKSENVRNLDFQSLFHHISCPAILFSAEGSKAAAKPADIIELKKMIPHLQEVHFDGAGHNIRREQFEKYVESVQTFLDTLLS